MKVLKRSECSILDLVLKSKWFEMIESRDKLEEYRDYKPHWVIRLCNWDDCADKRKPRVVEFRCGYSKSAPRVAFMAIQFKWRAIHQSFRFATAPDHPEWGEPKGPHFVIELGQRVILTD